MASPSVRVNHDDLKSIQQKFRAEADAVQATNRSLQGNLETLQRGDWVGRGAQAFYQEMNNDVMPAMKRLAEVLAEAARAVQEVSKRMKAAEGDASAVLRGE